MRHSLIVPYRDRPESPDILELWDRAISLQDRTGWEFILVDLDGDDDDDYDYYYDHHLNLHHIWINHPGTFSRSKALNEGAKRATGEYLTIADIDCLPEPPDHFQKIAAFYSRPENASMRLGNHIHWLDANAVRIAKMRRPNDPYTFIVESAFPLIEHQYKNTFAVVEHEGHCLGNSHFTIRRDQFDDLGGFDERFVGHGWEDIEFSRRYFQHYQQPTLMDGPHLWHVAHALNQNPDYDGDQITNANYRHFKDVEAAGFPKLARVKNEIGKEK